jgi:hypothetical protein
MLEERIARRADALAAIPEEHKPVIAKLAHERSRFFILWALVFVDDLNRIK